MHYDHDLPAFVVANPCRSSLSSYVEGTVDVIEVITQGWNKGSSAENTVSKIVLCWIRFECTSSILLQDLYVPCSIRTLLYALSIRMVMIIGEAEMVP